MIDAQLGRQQIQRRKLSLIVEKEYSDPEADEEADDENEEKEKPMMATKELITETRV